MRLPLQAIQLPERDLRESIDWESIDELADSLRDNGQLQPIGIRPLDAFAPTQIDDGYTFADCVAYIANGGKFEVVFGARRTRAAQRLEWTHIEATIVTATDERTTASHKLLENIQRENLTPIEEASGLLDLIGDDEVNMRDLQRRTGKSREWIRTRLELATMSDDLQDAVQDGRISAAVARAFILIEDAEVRKRYIDYATENKLNAEDARYFASNWEAAATGTATMRDFEQTLEERTASMPYAPQVWSCFVCREPHEVQNCSQHIICRQCQGIITTGRTPGE